MNFEEKVLSTLETMQGNMETMQGKMETMQGDIGELKQGQAELKEIVDYNRQALARIDYEHGKKIDIMLDVLDVHTEKFEEFAPLAEKVEDLSIIVGALVSQR